MRSLSLRRTWRTFLWRRWGRDWSRAATAAGLARRLTDGVAARDVLLLHDADHYSAPGSWRQTAQAVPRVLAALEARGLETTTLP